MENVRFEVHIQKNNGRWRDTVFTFTDLSTGKSYFGKLPEYAKQIPIDELNASTRFISDVRNDKYCEYKFMVSSLDGEYLIEYSKTFRQREKEFYEDLLPAILGS